MRKIVLATVGTAAIVFLTRESGAQDCDYFQENYRAYLQTCAAMDGCANKARMESMVAERCGSLRSPSATTRSSTAITPSPKPDPPALPAKSPYEGQACAYFTRDAIERTEMTTSLNYYAEGSHVCYQKVMYECRAKRWKSWGDCTRFQGWEKMQAEVLEKKP